jgi:hypothetical protein
MPDRIPLPARPANHRPLRLYTPIWRGDPGDSIHGYILAAGPLELPSGEEMTCLMMQLVRPAHVVIFDHGDEDRDVVLEPVDRVTSEVFSIAGVPVDRASLARLVVFSELPEATDVEITRVDRPGPRRYYVTIGASPMDRAKVDPIYIARLAEAQRQAALNNRPSGRP